jgi:hypothetical protein
MSRRIYLAPLSIGVSAFLLFIRKVHHKMKITIASKLVFFSLCITLLIGAGINMSPSVYAAPHPQSLPSNCYKVLVHLNGSNPANITCQISGKLLNGKMVPVISGKIVPHTTIAPCGATTNALIFTAINVTYCFSGVGYLGFKIIQQVIEVGGGPYRLWTLYYHGGPGIKLYLKVDGEADNPPFDGHEGITQIDINY